VAGRVAQSITSFQTIGERQIPAAPEKTKDEGDKTPAYVEWMRNYHPDEFQKLYQGRKTHLTASERGEITEEREEGIVRYGDGPGFLEFYPKLKTWAVAFDHGAVVVDATLSKKNGEERPFLDILETMHVASMTGASRQRWVSRSAIAPARRVVFRELARAIKDLDPGPFEKMAASIKALADLANRDMEKERIINSIVRCARLLNRVPLKGEVRDFHNREHQRGKNSYEAQGWNFRLETIGFAWLPQGKRGQIQRVKTSKKFT
jgi:hypothetical protein